MCRHLGFEHCLDDPLDDASQEVGIVRQDGLRRCGDAGTLLEMNDRRDQ